MTHPEVPSPEPGGTLTVVAAGEDAPPHVRGLAIRHFCKGEKAVVSLTAPSLLGILSLPRLPCATSCLSLGRKPCNLHGWGALEQPRVAQSTSVHVSTKLFGPRAKGGSRSPRAAWGFWLPPSPAICSAAPNHLLLA